MSKIHVVEPIKPARSFIAPTYSLLARFIIRSFGSLYLRYVEGIKAIKFHNEDLLVEAFMQLQKGQTPLILAFRHTAKEDAPSLMWALQKELSKSVRSLPKKERCETHAHFLYGSDVLEWAPKAASWLFPRLGAVGIQNRSSNKQAMDTIRSLLLESPFPIALAPEGQVTYHMFESQGIAHGASSIAYYALEQHKDVTIIPIAMGYLSQKGEKLRLQELLQMWEKLTGEVIQHKGTKGLLEVTDVTFSLVEKHLHLFHPDKNLIDRRDAICETLLHRSEQLLHLSHEGTFLDRLFAIRYSALDIQRPRSYHKKSLHSVEHALMNVRALEAHTALYYSQIVDVLEYVDPSYIEQKESVIRQVEYMLNILDILNRLQGGNIDSRYSFNDKTAHIYIGSPITLQGAKTSPPKKRKQQIIEITDLLHNALQTSSSLLEPLLDN